ncbi:MAG: long-chain fatty acid--CoA ligase, partial [Sphingopyxis sp.]|nr:long-chain fatty acid--CoA ligase [Sphingopyxis sp.]
MAFHQHGVDARWRPEGERPPADGLDSAHSHRRRHRANQSAVVEDVHDLVVVVDNRNVRIADPETNTELPRGQPGEIQFRGGGAFKAYYNDPEATKAAILPEGWVKTGDRGRMDGDGALTFLGQTKRVFVSGQGPAVIVMAEMPGIYPHVARFARWVRGAADTIRPRAQDKGVEI